MGQEPLPSEQDGDPTEGATDPGTDLVPGEPEAPQLPGIDVEGVLGPRASLPVVWESCDLLTDRSAADPALVVLRAAVDFEILAECATLEQPRSYIEPDGATLPVFVKRIVTSEPRRGQLWLLNGGPGLSGRSLEDFALLVAQHVPDLEIYLPDHRGTGRSSLFECEETFGDGADLTVELPSCGRELEDTFEGQTAAYRTTEAALDMVDLVQRLRREDEPVLLHGNSYGTFLLHRVLQLAPTLAQAAVFESSITPLGRADFLELARAPTVAGERLLGLCAEDAECEERLGADPLARALEMLDTFEQTCPELTERSWTRTLLQSVATIALDNPGSRSLLPAMFYRLGRCESLDVDWIEAFLTFVLLGGELETLPASPQAQSSRALFFHITFSELVARSSTRAELMAAVESEVFTSAFRNLPLAEAFVTWPRYPKDVYFAEPVNTDMRLLIVHGELDPRTAVVEAEQLSAQYPAANQLQLRLPSGGHLPVLAEARVDAELSCGAELTLQFLSDPEAVLDTSCAEQNAVPDFSARSDLVESFAPGQGVWD